MARSFSFVLAFLAVLGLGPVWAADQTVAISNGLGAAIRPVVSTAVEASHVLKSGPGSLYGFQVSFSTCAVSPCWVLVFDATSLPGDGAVTPVKFYEVSQSQTLGVNWAPGPPLKFATGITIGCSTTGPFVLANTAQCTISGEAQ